MPHAPFIIASFAVTAVGMIWLVLSCYLSMRRAEALADEMKERS